MLVPPQDESHARKRAPKASQRHSQSVLLIEDDAWIRTFLRDVLSDEGFVVIEAADGKTGLNLAFEHCPDIVLLDLAMPEFTGMDVLHGLQRMQRTRTIPVIVLSAYAAVLAPADASAVASVLAKPTDIPVLLEAIRDAVESGAAKLRSVTKT